MTLTEVLTAVAIIGILAGIAAPNFQSWIRGSQIRNAAESITNGLQRARAEAVKRNTNVAFALGAGADSSWSVYVVSPASAVESRPGSDGSRNVTRTVLPGGASTVTFDSFGRPLSSNSDGSARLVQVNLDSSASATVNQDLRVTIGPGGNARMCDPHASNTSPNACS
jgi:type IV fimbrial biogenesis protein FimT